MVWLTEEDSKLQQEKRKERRLPKQTTHRGNPVHAKELGRLLLLRGVTRKNELFPRRAVAGTEGGGRSAIGHEVKKSLGVEKIQRFFQCWGVVQTPLRKKRSDPPEKTFPPGTLFNTEKNRFEGSTDNAEGPQLLKAA